MNSTSATKPLRRKPPPSSDTSSSDKLDQILLSTAIANNEDLSPFVRTAFASGKPDTLLHHLRTFSRLKDSDIEHVCKAHYRDFILAVDDLRSLLSDVDSLRSSLSLSNSSLHSVASPLLSSLDAFVQTKTVSDNLSLATRSVRTCLSLITLCARANSHLVSGNFYLALRCVDQIEREFVVKDCGTPSTTIRNMLEDRIPAIRADIERRVGKEFGDWLVEIRTVSRNLGQLAIGQASAARQREEELR